MGRAFTQHSSGMHCSASCSTCHNCPFPRQLRYWLFVFKISSFPRVVYLVLHPANKHAKVVQYILVNFLTGGSYSWDTSLLLVQSLTGTLCRLIERELQRHSSQPSDEHDWIQSNLPTSSPRIISQLFSRTRQLHSTGVQLSLRSKAIMSQV